MSIFLLDGDTSVENKKAKHRDSYDLCVELRKLKRDAEKVKEDSLLKSIDGKGKMGYIEVNRWWKERCGVALQVYEEISKLDEKAEAILAKFTTLFRASP